jgi:hypothetical protein
MKKIILIVFLAIVALNTSVVNAKASETKKESVVRTGQTSNDSKLTDAEAQQLVNRVYEIQKMDKSSLTSAQKKELKIELVGIKQKVMKDPDGVVFVFSGAGLVLLIVLLILLL